jgi:hypothetical protein
MKLKVTRHITLEYFSPMVAKAFDPIFIEHPRLELICPRCGDVCSMPLSDGMNYDKREADNTMDYLRGMRDYFKEMTDGKLDLIASYNQFLLTDLRVKIEIDELTK